MDSLLIFYLTDNRRHYSFKPFIDLMSGSKYGEKWKIIILTHSDDVKFYQDILKDAVINFEIFEFDEYDNYMIKVRFAIRFALENNFEYIMKCDNDIFLLHQTLDFIMENLNLLNNPKNLTLVPCLSNGIPSVEYFINDFLNKEAKIKIENLFSQTLFFDRDGAEYSSLNEYTTGKIWDHESFFSRVKGLDHHYKGVHPIRFNEDAQDFLNEYIINHKEQFFEENRDLSILINDTCPYLCNSIFVIRRDVYDEIVSDSSLFVDYFDEVPLNKYCWKHNLSHLFIKNGFAIHMYYNWYQDYLDKEERFIQKLFNH